MSVLDLLEPGPTPSPETLTFSSAHDVSTVPAFLGSKLSDAAQPAAVSQPALPLLIL